MEDPFIRCCRTNQLDEIEQLVPRNNINLKIFNGFLIACENKSFDVIEFLINGLVEKDRAFRSACSNGHLDAAKLILSLSHDEININSIDSYAFRYACKNGHLNVVEFLLSNPDEFESEINVNVLDDFAFLMSCKHNHLDIVKLLASIRGKYEIDISRNGYAAFRSACEYGSLDVVKFLLQTYNINVHSKNEYAFQLACENGHLDVVKLLVENYEIKINAQDDYALRWACKNGFLEIVKFLLSLSTNSLFKDNNSLFKINPHAKDNYAFRWACKEENADVADYLADRFNRNQYEFYYREKNQYYIVLPLDFETNKGEDKFVMFDDFKVHCRKAKYLENCIEAYKVHYVKFTRKSARK